ncbi:conserved hypothetical protein [Pediculus humanus corporis]|uniref:Factor VIII intron 22 protein n=1 Tax=Pediculus humanus subsp. corporis TaxID=121224 RepID=E0VTB0_PEDHC|nr:uncharacterized protein Phum_PHUM429910 [Pediculus humanus corporis]EEB16616.1 conserved hypothetical protein [Pediculus humanus corporis]
MYDEKVDILNQYQFISDKLRKKKILKKPNVAEASQQFENLGKFCEREDLPEYAGLNYESAAKCQNSLGNHSEEAFLYLKSSKQFMTSYLKQKNNQLVLNNSYLNHSLISYKNCLERLEQNNECSNLVNNMIMGGITLKMGHDLQEKIEAVEESCHEYKKAVQLFSNSPVEKIQCLNKLVSSKINSGDFSEALKLVEDIISIAQTIPANSFKENCLCEAEITRIFLLLILQPTPQQISPAAASALEKYAWLETSSTNEIIDLQTTLKNYNLTMISEDLFLNLQSLVMACQYGEEEVVKGIEIDLTPYLNFEQKMLLSILVKRYGNKN